MVILGAEAEWNMEKYFQLLGVNHQSTIDDIIGYVNPFTGKVFTVDTRFINSTSSFTKLIKTGKSRNNERKQSSK